MSDVTEVTDDVMAIAMDAFREASCSGYPPHKVVEAIVEAVMPIGQQDSTDINQLTIERDNLQARLEVMRERKDKAEAERDAAVFANRDAMDHFKQMEAATTEKRMKTGIEQIADERQRQVEAEGFKPEHDDVHTDGELSDAAACYALGKQLPVWPWSTDWWNPGEAVGGGRVRDLVKAGALLAAEIDRINRLTPNP